MILVLDFGSQYTQLIARRLREQSFYSEVLAWNSPALPGRLAATELRGIILSGGPDSVYHQDAPTLPASVLEAGVPVLGICYGLQLLVQTLGGQVSPAEQREYGPASLRLEAAAPPAGWLGEGERMVWMSHGDRVDRLPEGFVVFARTDDAPFAAVGDVGRSWYGLQFHPEVAHTQQGTQLLAGFAQQVCDAQPVWTPEEIIQTMVEEIRTQVGGQRAIVGVSGGVDSSVAAALVHRAIGDRLSAVFVDNGLLRHDERAIVEDAFGEHLKAPLTVVDASKEFLEDLKGTLEPEEKRKRIGARFIRTFEKAAHELGDPPFLVQGTIYPDVIESSDGSKSARKIKAHHNVGGLPEDMEFKLVEPLRKLFKDEVRAVGEALGLPKKWVWRQPFPGPGLAVRCLGPITAQRLSTLREADRIFTELLEEHGLLIQEETQKGTQGSAQAFAVLLPVRSVGVMGDGRTYDEVVALRAVQTTDFMTAEWSRLPYELLAEASRKIVNEVPGVNRVVYDITTKPPGTIEWE